MNAKPGRGKPKRAYKQRLHCKLKEKERREMRRGGAAGKNGKGKTRGELETGLCLEASLPRAKPMETDKENATGKENEAR